MSCVFTNLFELHLFCNLRSQRYVIVLGRKTFMDVCLKKQMMQTKYKMGLYLTFYMRHYKDVIRDQNKLSCIVIIHQCCDRIWHKSENY